MKPVLSFALTTLLPSFSPNARPAANASSSVVTVRMTSSSGMTCAGLKKCSPMKRPLTPPLSSIPIRWDLRELVKIEDRGAVRHIVLNRPEKRNAFNGELIEATGRAFEDAAADDSVRVVVVRGNGPMFSSGMD